MPNPGYPRPWNNWLGWQYEPKANAYYGQSANRILYLNSHLKHLSGQATNDTSQYFSGATRSAVVNYQTFWGLHVDGWVGPQTWGVLDWHADL